MIYYYYKITNIKNGRFYIGITTNTGKRKKEHFNQLKKQNHANYKLQQDYNVFGEENFIFEIVDSLETDSVELAYQKEYDLIHSSNATIIGYNLHEGGKTNPVYSLQILEKIAKSHQKKYENILQYLFDGHKFILISEWNGLREAARKTNSDFRAIQNSCKTTQAHHNFYWVKENEKEEWLNKFLKRHTCCVAKINETNGLIEDTALTIKEFAEKYNTTYDRIYHSLKRGDRAERKYKFIRISAEQFAEINNLFL